MTKATTSSPGASAQAAAPHSQAGPLILRAGLIAGCLDITAAFVYYAIKTGKSPWPILNYVASGVFGQETAYAGQVLMPALGLLFHFMIATIFAAIFYAAWPLIRKLNWHWVLTGLVYGILVWCAMNLVVVPLSNTPGGKSTTSGIIINMLILMFCIGLPIAGVIARRRG